MSVYPSRELPTVRSISPSLPDLVRRCLHAVDLRRTGAVVALCMGLAIAGTAPAAAAGESPGTPPELVATYSGLADMLLAGKQTELDLVRSILATTYGHAQAAMAHAQAGGAAAGEALETLAALVSQLGNEGDASVGAIRKRLVEGGHHHHHHHADDSADDEYDEGFVIVTKAAKKVFLDASKAIGKLAAAPDMKALEIQWKIVTTQYQALMEASGS